MIRVRSSRREDRVKFYCLLVLIKFEGLYNYIFVQKNEPRNGKPGGPVKEG